jgi:hypothetical protein
LEGEVMGILTQFDFELQPSKPNAQGLCTFKIVDCATKQVIAETEELSTLEYALIAARNFIKREYQNGETEE